MRTRSVTCESHQTTAQDTRPLEARAMAVWRLREVGCWGALVSLEASSDSGNWRAGRLTEVARVRMQPGGLAQGRS